jgi:hypothetical protein
MSQLHKALCADCHEAIWWTDDDAETPLCDDCVRVRYRASQQLVETQQRFLQRRGEYVGQLLTLLADMLEQRWPAPRQER